MYDLRPFQLHPLRTYPVPMVTTLPVVTVILLLVMMMMTKKVSIVMTTMVVVVRGVVRWPPLALPSGSRLRGDMS